MAVRELYKTRDGVRVPSVTTILGRFKESGGLLHWANQAGLDGLTLDEARTPAASAGTLAHDMVEAHINGRPPPEYAGPKETLEKAKAAFVTYEKWFRLNKITIRHTEVSLVSEKNRYGGRLDAVGLDGEPLLILLDWKTSNAVYPDHILQLAGYKGLWEENYPDHPLTGGFHLCRFAKEEGDFSHHYFPSLDFEFEVFVEMRQLYDRIKIVEKRVK